MMSSKVLVLLVTLYAASFPCFARQTDKTVIDKFITAQSAKENGEEPDGIRQVVSGDLNHDGVPDTAVQQQAELTEANWREHPKIKAIRRIVGSVNAGLKRGAFKTSHRELDCGDSSGSRRIARKSSGAVNWYQDYTEGQDASWDFHYYYDPTERLRFVLASARHANGTREQLRLYFDETGKRIWTNRVLRGRGCPGCFSAYYDSDEALARDAGKAFANDEGCKEIKPAGRKTN